MSAISWERFLFQCIHIPEVSRVEFDEPCGGGALRLHLQEEGG